MPVTSRWIVRAVALAVVLGPGAVTGASQGTGTVSGRVVDAATRAPVGSVQVTVVGTSLGTLTAEDGRYTLRGVPVGTVTLAASRLGYQRETRTVDITMNAATTADFEFRAVAFSLEDVVVTATGEERRRESGNAIATIDAARVVAEAPVANTAELLTARAAGVQVLQSSGTVGMGSRIRIRGANSASLTNEPIVYVDGVRVSNANTAVSYETGGDAPSRINDLDPDDIESIEIVKGPSAATLYGTDAANGVVWITTKRGRSGSPRWTASVQQGATTDPYTYPASFRGMAADGTACRLVDVAAGTCTQARVESLSPLEHDHTSPFRTGTLQQYGLSVAGGREGFGYYVSGDLQRDEGVLPGNLLNRVNVRGNFDLQLSQTFSASVSSGYLSSKLTFPLNGNYELGIIGNGLASTGSESVLGGWGFFPMEQLLSVRSGQNVQRFIGSVRATWTPFAFLTNRVTVGLDNVDQLDDQFFPTGEAPAWLGYENGARFANRFQGATYSADAVSTASFLPLASLSSETSVGVQYVRDRLVGTLASGLGLVAGAQSIAAAARTTGGEATTENIKVGAFIQEKVGYRDRLFVTGALRADDASAFGQQFDVVVYPKLSASWVASEESFFPQIPLVNSLRVRAAWGESGLQPGSTDALRFFTPVPVTLGGESVTGVTFGSLGNPSLKPERSREFEVGFDSELLQSRIGVQFSYYNKRTSDALIFRELPRSFGAGSGRFDNLGSVQNTGFEMLLTTRPVSTPSVAWNLTFNGAVNDNELLELGTRLPRVVLSGTQRHVVGYPLGGYWSRPIVGFGDANGDGIIVASEVQLGDTAVYLGTPFAKRQLSVHNEFTLAGRVRLAALLEHRGGQKLYNNTEAWRSQQNITFPLNDPSAPLAEQARAVAYSFLGAPAGYIEDASFWKLREVSATLDIPSAFAERIRASRVTVTVAGRNLATWTDYSGLDPEINQIGQANFITSDFMAQAPVRSWTARLNVTF